MHLGIALIIVGAVLVAGAWLFALSNLSRLISSSSRSFGRTFKAHVGAMAFMVVGGFIAFIGGILLIWASI